MKTSGITSISELISSIKDVLEGEFQEVVVQGEISNLSCSGAGHWYFNLSDEKASLSCALFRMDAFRNPIIKKIKDGDEVIISGPLSVYQKRGTFQLLSKQIIPAGEGKLKFQFEKLKMKLAQEGLFDLSFKKKLPDFPKRVAVITAKSGAALADFINVFKRRSLWFDILIVPSLVQGEDAPSSLIKALKTAQEKPDVDVIVLTRGGGSLEDLWAFNDENLVRAIFECPLPVLSAVGHQVDYTLCDYVADHRSETPTAAAETLTQPQTQLKSRLTFCYTHLRSELFKTYQSIQLMIEKFHPKEILRLIQEQIFESSRRLSQIQFKDRAKELTGVLESSQRLDEAILKLRYSSELEMQLLSSKLTRIGQVLEALNPSNVLQRGYSFVRRIDGELLGSYKDFEETPKGCKIEIQFFDGKGDATKD